MMKCLSILLVSGAACLTSNAQLLITGVMDGPNSGGEPKAVEFFALQDIDFSATPFTLETSPNEGAGSPPTPYSFSGTIDAGQYLVVAHSESAFTDVFGVGGAYPDQLVIKGGVSVVNINGDDFLTLKQGDTVVDSFTSTDYQDKWAYRVSNTGPDATYNADNWTFGTFDENGLPIDGEGTPVFGTYLNISAVPEPEEYALVAGLGLVGFAAWHRRRKSVEA